MINPRRLVRGLLVGVAAATMIIWGGAASAAAHNTLRSTDPSDGSTVASTPGAVVLTFDEPAIALGTQLVVDGPNGRVETGPARLVDNTVTQALQPGSPAGVYTVTWRVTSADGHPVSGTFTFTATAANPDPPTAEAPAPERVVQATPVFRWEWVVLAVGLLAVGLVIRREVRRSRRTP